MSQCGGADKRKKGIFQATLKVFNELKPKAQNELIWKRLRNTKPKVKAGGTVYEVYVDGNKIVQVNDKTGKESDLTRSSWNRYLTEIRKKNRSN